MKFVFKVGFVGGPADAPVYYRNVEIEKDARFKAVDAFWDALRAAGFAVGNTVVPRDVGDAEVAASIDAMVALTGTPKTEPEVSNGRDVAGEDRALEEGCSGREEAGRQPPRDAAEHAGRGAGAASAGGGRGVETKTEPTAPDFYKIAKDTLEKHDGWAHLEPGVLAYELAMAYEAGQQNCPCPRGERAPRFEEVHYLCIDSYSKLWRGFNELQEKCAGVYAATGVDVLQRAGVKARKLLDETRAWILRDATVAGPARCPARKLKDWMLYVCGNDAGHAGCAAGIHSWRLTSPEVDAQLRARARLDEEGTAKPKTEIVGVFPAGKKNFYHNAEQLIARPTESQEEDVPADDPDREGNPAIRAMRWRTRALAAEEANKVLRAPWEETLRQGWRGGVSDALDAIDGGGGDGPNTKTSAYKTIEALLKNAPGAAQ